MAKRRLNKQQQWRIEKIQSERTQRAQKRERDIRRQSISGELSSEQSGIVISHFGQQLDIEALEGEDKGTIHRCHARTNLGQLVTGDKVIWRAGKDLSGVIEARLDRETLLVRPDNYGQLKPVAANIDTIFIVVAVEPEPIDILIDRYLVACETTGIPPVILLNKTDLISDTNRERIEKLIDRYEKLGYPVLQASIHEEGGLTKLLSTLQTQTSVFVGQSGVGKSSLIQKLLPNEELRVGALSEYSGKGTHTTTTARLFHLPDGGSIIDSPGVREFGLWHISQMELLEGFIEFRPHLGLCKFRDCKHQKEPGCAIREAFEHGEISAERYHSFERIRQAIEEQNERGLIRQD